MKIKFNMNGEIWEMTWPEDWASRQVPDWQTAKIDACIDSMEMQLIGIRL